MKITMELHALDDHTCVLECSCGWATVGPNDLDANAFGMAHLRSHVSTVKSG